MSARQDKRIYPPEYVSAETLAYRLDCAVALIERYVRDGVLPPPRRIGKLERWRFADVEAVIEGKPRPGNTARGALVSANGVVGSENDPFLEGVRRVEAR